MLFICFGIHFFYREVHAHAKGSSHLPEKHGPQNLPNNYDYELLRLSPLCQSIGHTECSDSRSVIRVHHCPTKLIPGIYGELVKYVVLQNRLLHRCILPNHLCHPKNCNCLHKNSCITTSSLRCTNTLTLITSSPKPATHARRHHPNHHVGHQARHLRQMRKQPPCRVHFRGREEE